MKKMTKGQCSRTHCYQKPHLRKKHSKIIWDRRSQDYPNLISAGAPDPTGGAYSAPQAPSWI